MEKPEKFPLKLIEEWKRLYSQAEEIDERSDKGGADWESLCVGWCLAKGLSFDEAFEFYQAMIPLGFF